MTIIIRRRDYVMAALMVLALLVYDTIMATRYLRGLPTPLPLMCIGGLLVMGTFFIVGRVLLADVPE